MTRALSNKCASVLDAIGDTPIIRLNRVTQGLAAEIYAKIEFVNPGGSVKDRIAKAMVEEAERKGLLKPGATIIEATAGNTGVGLALVAAVKGYRCIFVMPDKMSAEKIRLLKAYGAEVVITASGADSNSPDGYGGVARRLANEIPNSWQPDQFTNMVNPQCHYEQTAKEIWEQTDGKVTAFVSGIGTGGTISGIGKYLKEKNPDVKIVAADPEGSILSGDKLKPWAVEGIGEDYVPKTFSAHVVDEWIRVSDADSFTTARNMARMEGLLVGGSCGTAMAAALKFAQRLGRDDLVVVMCPDTGRNYLSKMYADEWMIENGFMQSTEQPRSVVDLLDARGDAPVISVEADQMAVDAISLMREHGISQMPVLEDGKVIGGVRELALARLLHSRRDPRQVPVREIMAKPLPVVDQGVDLDEVYRLLQSGHSGVIILHGDEIAGIVTRMDLVDFWDRPLDDAAAATPVAVS